MDHEISQIKDAHYANIRQREVFMVIATDYGWQVQWRKAASVI